MTTRDIHEVARALGLRVRAAYPVRTAAKILGIGRETLYQAVYSGKVRAVRVGKVLYVPVAELARLLAEEELPSAREGRGGLPR